MPIDSHFDDTDGSKIDWNIRTSRVTSTAIESPLQSVTCGVYEVTGEMNALSKLSECKKLRITNVLAAEEDRGTVQTRRSFFCFLFSKEKKEEGSAEMIT